MPIYEYRCNHCGHQFEKLQKVTDEKIKVCPQCQQPAAERLISAAGFRLKGGGWYETDFKSGKEKKRNLAEQTNDAAKKKPAADKPAAKSASDKK